jgi:Tfp pilus assembly protein PilO
MKTWYRSAIIGVGVLAVILIFVWAFKLRNIQRLKTEILHWETQVSKGQELWQDFPPLSPEQKKEMQEAQHRLFSMLPKGKDIPPVLQEISRLARDYRLEEVTFKTGEHAPPGEPGRSQAGNVSQVVVSQPASPDPSKTSESSGPIDSFAVTVAFSGDYRQTAYFLAALQKIPRVVRIQSVKLQRRFPVVAAEVVLNAYYQKESLN